jgi:single-stranded-DNA-specific exonuclease
VGGSGKHLKFKVRQRDASNGQAIDVIGFGMGDQLSTLHESQRTNRPLELLFSLESNTWKGRTTLQLKARALRLADDA